MPKQEAQADAALTAASAHNRHAVGTAIGLVVFAVYLCLYFTTPVDGNQRLKHRFQALWNVFVPDDVINIWHGGAAPKSWTGILTASLAAVTHPEKLYVVAFTSGIFVVAWLLGAALMRWLRWDGGMNRKERFVLGIGVGLNLLSLYTLACGLLGMLNVVMPLLAVAASIYSAAVLVRAGRRDPDQSLIAIPRWPVNGRTFTTVCVWSAAGLLSLLILWAGAMPPSAYDVREYHLQMPKEWYQQGFIGFVPHNIYGNMPFGAEMHALFVMPLTDWWWGAIIGKTVIAAYLPLTALALYVINERLFGRVAGVTSMLLFLTFPSVFHNSVAGLIDTATAYYFVTAVYVAVIARCPDPDQPTFYRGRIALAGFLAGSAVACKYPSVLFLIVPILMWMMARQRIDPKAALIYLAATFAGCGLWLGKNLVLTGNPVYPLVYELFGGKTRTPEKNAQWTKAHRVDKSKLTIGHFTGSVKEALYQETWLSPAIIPLALLGVASARRRLLLLPIFVCLFDFVSWWFLTHRLDRFLLPTYAIAIMASGVGAQWWHEQGLGKYAVRALVAFSMLLSFFLMTAGYYRDSRYLVPISKLRADVPREDNPEFTRIHPAHRYLNEHVKPGNNVLCVGEAQVFDLEVGVVYNTCFDDCIFENIMKDKSRAERISDLQSRKITHVFIHWDEIRRFRSPGNYGYTKYVTRAVVQDLVNSRVLIPVPPQELNLHPHSGQVFLVAER